MGNNKDKANEYFNLGYNCSQSVVAAFAKDLGITEDEALRISSGFGGGMGNTEVCGAVTGAVIVLGLKYGHLTSGVSMEAVTSEFREKFKEKNHTINCKELLGYDISKAEDFEKVIENNLFNSFCPKMVSDAVDILEKMKK